MVNDLNNFIVSKIKNKLKINLALKLAALITVSFYKLCCIAMIALIYCEKMQIEKAQRCQPVNQINQKEYHYCLHLESRKCYTISMKNSYVLFL